MMSRYIISTFSCCCLCLCVQGFIFFPCLTPNNEEAFCVSIFSCPTLMKAMGSLDPFAVDFVKKSVCFGCSPFDMKVCCGSKSNYINRITPCNTTIQPQVTTLASSQMTIATTERTTTTTVATTFAQDVTPINRDEKIKLLASRAYCGFQHTDDRPYLENATALDEFPWLVHVIYLEDDDEDPDQYLDRCNGVLINNRYVLTSDYCVTDVNKVRLGQYNTNKTMTCIDDPDIPECTEPWIDVGVEKVIHRFNYTGEYLSKTTYNFGLLRLSENVVFSDFIRPICLPLEDSERPSPDQSLYFSGWGALSQDMIEKKRLVYKLTSNDDCYNIDNVLKADSVNISLMCLKPQEKNGELACTGDEAGPLMYQLRHQWFAEGIIMRVYHDGGDSAERCSNTHPISAGRITPTIINWILDNITE